MRFNVVLPPAPSEAEDKDKVSVWPNKEAGKRAANSSAPRMKFLPDNSFRSRDCARNVPSSNLW